MAATDTTEKGLESLIVAALTGHIGEAAPQADVVPEPTAPYGGAGYVEGDPADYDRNHAVDLAKLLAFLQAT
jgi:type I restriction enzyme R subunit